MCNYLLLFYGKNGYESAPQFYVIRALPVLIFPTTSQMKNTELSVFVLRNLFTWNIGVIQPRFCSVE